MNGFSTNKAKLTPIFFWIISILLGVAGGTIIAYSTSVAPWAFSDSTIYIAAGVNLFQGNGLGSTLADGTFLPLSHYPPMYSILLGLGSLIFSSVIDAARWLDIICFSLLIFGGMLLVWKITHSLLFATSFGLLLLGSPFLVQQFTGVMSEPFAILCGTLALLLLVLYRTKNQKRWLVFAALLAALSVLTRYLQIVIILTGCIFVLVISHGALRKRLLDTVLFGAISSVPLAGWLMAIFLNSHTVGARTVSLLNVKGITHAFLSNAYGVMKYWFPYRSNLIHGVNAETGRILLLVLFIGFSIFGLVRMCKREGNHLPKSPEMLLLIVAGLFIVVDLVFLWVASFMTQPPPAIDERMLVSLLPFLFLVLLSLIYVFVKSLQPTRWPKVLFVFTVLLFLVNFYPNLKGIIINLHGYGDGFTSLTWKNDPLIWKLKEISRAHPIISNSEAVVQFNTARAPYRVFEGVNDETIFSTMRYGDGSSTAQTVFRDQCGALVLFRPDLIRHYDVSSNIIFPPEAQHVTDGLTVLLEDNLGSIYVHPDCEPAY